MRELMKNPESGDFTWRRLTYVFALGNPRTLTPMRPSLMPEEREVVERFTEQARGLAETTFLGAGDKVQIDIADFGDAEAVRTELSDPDVTTGFMVLMRQCYANDEEASFAKVRKVLEHRLHEAGDTASLDVLKRWRGAHARLLNNALEELVQEQLIADGKMPAELPGPDGQMSSSVVRAPAAPAVLLRTFWYGGQVHWGSARTTLAAIQADPFDAGMWEISARGAATDFAHFYMGYALVVETILNA
jgi:hypothetical protein